MGALWVWADLSDLVIEVLGLYAVLPVETGYRTVSAYVQCVRSVRSVRAFSAGLKCNRALLARACWQAEPSAICGCMVCSRRCAGADITPALTLW